MNDEEQQAALDELATPPESVEETATVAEEVNAESAPATEEVAEEDGKPDGVQTRINKITAEKYAEKRRADELEAEIQRLKNETPKPVESNGAPTLEQFDYDEAAFQSALIDYKVEQKARQIEETQKAAEQRRMAEANQQRFNSKVAEFGAEDYQDVVGALPQLPGDVLDAIMGADDGPQLAYYLGKHLDVADQITQMSPMAAAMKLGAISAQIAAKPSTKQVSAAPDPITPISGGASTSKDLEDMSMAEFMAADTG
jgi:hypothetical protein